MQPSPDTEANEASGDRQRQVRTPPAASLDFSHRVDPATLPEWMDEPCTYQQFRACVRDLASVNRWTLGYRPTLRFVKRAVASTGAQAGPLRIADVGCGGGDTLRKIAGWAHRRRVRAELTGVDLNPHATRASAEFSGADPRFATIQWRTGDALTLPDVQNADLILSALVTHHMTDAEIVAFLRWMERTAQRGWFINDLLRSRKAYRLFVPLARLMRWHPFVQHDGPVSIRRGFHEADWQRLLGAAGIPLATVQLSQPAPGRLCLARLR